MYMSGKNNLDSHFSNYFTKFLSKPGHDPKIFMDFPLMTYLLSRNLCKESFLYNFDIHEGAYIEELAQRNIGRFHNTVKFLRSNNYIFHRNGIDNFFNFFFSLL